MDFNSQNKAYLQQLANTLSKVEDIQLAKKRLTYLRWKVAENLDKLLFEYETNVKKTDANVLFAPTIALAIEYLNKHLKPFSKVNFLEHNAVKKMVNNGNVIVPEVVENPDAMVVGAKFLAANTGNIFIGLNNVEEYSQILGVKKLVVIAGIDSLLASQADLPIAKQLYAIYEKGRFNYAAEILTRPGKPRGLQCEVVLILIDDGRSKLLTNPIHRPLFSLLNFDLPPVCPMQQVSMPKNYWENIDTLSYFLFPFINDLNTFKQPILANYGLQLLNNYLPYDIDMGEQVIEARAYYHQKEKKNALANLLDTDKLSIVLNTKKYNDKEKFKKFAEQHFFGKF